MALGEPLREKIVNAIADDPVIGASFDDDTLYHIADIALKTIIDELTRGVVDAQTE